MLEESITGSNLSRKATLLMAEVLHKANKVLPLSVAAKIQVRIGSASQVLFNSPPDYTPDIRPGIELQPRRAANCGNLSVVCD